MADVQKIIGERIRNCRKAREYTIEELAVRAGVNTAQLGKIERGERNFTIRTLHRIITALGVEYMDIFDFAREPSTPENPMIYKTVSQLKILTVKEQQLIYHTASMLANKKG